MNRARRLVSRGQPERPAPIEREPLPSIPEPEPDVSRPTLRAQIYGRESCPWCMRAVALLEREKIEHTFIDLSPPGMDNMAMQIAAETKQDTVPYVYLGGEFIGGFKELDEIHRLGMLHERTLLPEERAASPRRTRIEVMKPAGE